MDAVFVASSTDTHVDLITRGVKAGKAVLCEKPIDLDIARVEACWAEIGSLDPLVMIGFNRRFQTRSSHCAPLVACEIGKREQVVIISRDPALAPAEFLKASGGLFRDMTIHDFDMVRYLAGDIVEVQAMGANLIDRGIQTIGDVDVAMVTLRAASGALVHIKSAAAAPTATTSASRRSAKRGCCRRRIGPHDHHGLER